MNERGKTKIGEIKREFEIKKEGKVKILEIPIKIEVTKDNFLHIGVAPSPLTEKKGAVFKVDGTPMIPATSFKGALRHQLELLFIEKIDEFTQLFNVNNDKKDTLKPCIPSPRPTKAEEELVKLGYRKQRRRRDIVTEGCWIEVDEKKYWNATAWHLSRMLLYGY